MTNQTAQDLRATADVLRRDGWRNDGKARGMDRDTCRCVAQALHFAIAGDDHRMLNSELAERYNTARAHLEATVGVASIYLLFEWNDADGRTADQVIAALEAAAGAAERA